MPRAPWRARARPITSAWSSRATASSRRAAGLAAIAGVSNGNAGCCRRRSNNLQSLGRVAIAFRADLHRFLGDFIEHLRGLRLGRMFGVPAGYAGRRMFVCLIEDGFIVKDRKSVV